MPKVFRHRFTVPEDAVDVNGHINNVVYVQWMQDVAVRHSDAQGCTLEKYQSLQATWVVRSHHIDYLREGFAEDELEIQTWVADLKRSTSRRRYRFLRVKDQAVLAEAETNWVFVDTRRGRPVAVHEDVRNAFELAGEDDLPALV